MVKTGTIKLSSKGFTQMFDITGKVDAIVKKSGIKDGIVTVFCVGSTAGITTIEFESGLVADLPEMFERLIPYKAGYKHDATWGDANGGSHLRASLLGPSITIPFTGSSMHLGAWQQICFIDFDTKPRSREIVVQIIGE
ncbi:MAG TPA: secondary thiamine-phosphate synthase enzyme YjbQ [Oscillospiraceae bacterium]|nr:secondary thiamine-phosphate synthase enzyme YjbQ [Oscillospiraceae bacterium]